jgi:hypothetical protein
MCEEKRLQNDRWEELPCFNVQRAMCATCNLQILGPIKFESNFEPFCELRRMTVATFALLRLAMEICGESKDLRFGPWNTTPPAELECRSWIEMIYLRSFWKIRIMLRTASRGRGGVQLRAAI